MTNKTTFFFVASLATCVTGLLGSGVKDSGINPRGNNAGYCYDLSNEPVSVGQSYRLVCHICMCGPYGRPTSCSDNLCNQEHPRTLSSAIVTQPANLNGPKITKQLTVPVKIQLNHHAPKIQHQFPSFSKPVHDRLVNENLAKRFQHVAPSITAAAAAENAGYCYDLSNRSVSVGQPYRLLCHICICGPYRRPTSCSDNLCNQERPRTVSSVIVNQPVNLNLPKKSNAASVPVKIPMNTNVVTKKPHQALLLSEPLHGRLASDNRVRVFQYIESSITAVAAENGKPAKESGYCYDLRKTPVSVGQPYRLVCHICMCGPNGRPTSCSDNLCDQERPRTAFSAIVNQAAHPHLPSLQEKERVLAKIPSNLHVAPKTRNQAQPMSKPLYERLETEIAATVFQHVEASVTAVAAAKSKPPKRSKYA